MQVDRDKLHELKHKRAKLVEEMRILVKQDEERPDGEAMSEESSAAFDDLKDAIADIEGRITRLETLMMASAPDDEGKAEGGDDDDKPKDKPDDDDDKRFGPYDGKGLASMHGVITPGGVRVYARPKGHGSIGPGFQIARFMIGVLHAKWNGREKACEFIQNRFGDDIVTRALNTTVVSEGGALIPQDFMSELIELLRANVVVRAAGPTTVQMPMGNLTIPRLAGGSTAAYQGELDDISISEEQFDDLDLFAKKLTAMVPVSNDLIRRAPIGIEAIVRDDLIQGIARREDLAFLRGDGTNKTPIGWRSLVLPANVLVIPVKGANPGDDLNAVVAALAAMKLVLVNGMSRMIKPTWFFAPTLIEYIKTRRDSVGSFYYREEINNGRLRGLPLLHLAANSDQPRRRQRLRVLSGRYGRHDHWRHHERHGRRLRRGCVLRHRRRHRLDLSARSVAVPGDLGARFQHAPSSELGDRHHDRLDVYRSARFGRRAVLDPAAQPTLEPRAVELASGRHRRRRAANPLRSGSGDDLSIRWAALDLAGLSSPGRHDSRGSRSTAAAPAREWRAPRWRE